MFCRCFTGCYNYDREYRNKLARLWSYVLWIYTLGSIIAIIWGGIETKNRLSIKLILGGGVALFHLAFSGMTGFILGQYAAKEVDDNIRKALTAHTEACREPRTEIAV